MSGYTAWLGKVELVDGTVLDYEVINARARYDFIWRTLVNRCGVRVRVRSGLLEWSCCSGSSSIRTAGWSELEGVIPQPFVLVHGVGGPLIFHLQCFLSWHEASSVQVAHATPLMPGEADPATARYA